MEHFRRRAYSTHWFIYKINYGGANNCANVQNTKDTRFVLYNWEQLMLCRAHKKHSLVLCRKNHSAMLFRLSRQHRNRTVGCSTEHWKTGHIGLLPIMFINEASKCQQESASHSLQHNLRINSVYNNRSVCDWLNAECLSVSLSLSPYRLICSLRSQQHLSRLEKRVADASAEAMQKNKRNARRANARALCFAKQFGKFSNGSLMFGTKSISMQQQMLCIWTGPSLVWYIVLP